MMDDKYDHIEETASSFLSRTSREEVANNTNLIKEKVLLAANVNYPEVIFSDEEIELIVRKLEERFDITMAVGEMFYSDDYKPWLAEAKSDIDWYYWRRYKQYMQIKKFPNDVITKTDIITDEIIDHMENPIKDGQWSRRGMVVGDVQSGKTANYTGVICKAADCGYKVIIVLAGLLNSLRNQTQTRIDSGFIGKCTTFKTLIGVGEISSQKQPAYFTTSTSDFKKSIANSIGVEIGHLRESAVFIVKKNKHSLSNLIDWLTHNNRHGLKDMPMLLIDDEADHASINTNKGDGAATAINSKIRELLNLFGRASYVGYTATPFANIFIDPESTDEMIGNDLFPKDFIYSLEAPTNYFGPKHIFLDETTNDIVNIVSDNEDYLPIKHKKDFELLTLPLSLKKAIACFVLARAIRLLRKHVKKHHSMMINVSRFTNVQTQVKEHVFNYITQMRESIICNFALSSAEASKNPDINFLHSVWEEQYIDCGFEWQKIQKFLKDAVSPIEVIEVNSSPNAKPLDYDIKNYPNGRSLVAVGGLALSRGLTLEGLSISYFLRNSKMYDTLMQMGRWFGYRDGYSDLCRIFMTEGAYSWYSYIAGVITELRNEFTRMKKADMTPAEFGLCVRSHPETLIVTARNKMRSATRVVRQVCLEGRLIETSILINKKKVLELNRTLLNETFFQLQSHSDYYDETNTSGFTWKNIPSYVVIDFVNNFANHPISQLTSPTPVIDYIKHLAKDGDDAWDVCLISPKNANKHSSIGGIIVNHQKRTSSIDNGAIYVNKGKRRVGYAIQESAGLKREIVEEASEKFKQDNLTVSGALYRNLRRKHPLLLLHLVDCYTGKDDKEEELHSGVVAYGISFPGIAGSRRPKKLVEYEVNTVWWKNEYENYEQEELDDE